MGVDKRYNQIDDMPYTPSYSMMHLFRQEIQVVMYSCIDKIYLNQLKMHQSTAGGSIMGEYMSIISHEPLYRAGSHRRTNT